MIKDNTVIKYGLYGALLGLVVQYLLLASGNSPWSSASWMGCWIPGITVYYVLKITTEEDIYLSYFNAYKKSMSVVFYQALFYSVLSILISFILNTGAVELYKAEMMQNAEQLAAFMGEEMYNQVITELDSISYTTLTFWDFIYKLIGGAIVSLILAAIFKKNKPIYENE